MCRLMFIYWKDFAEATLSYTEPHKKKITRTRTHSWIDLLAIIKSHRWGFPGFTKYYWYVTMEWTWPKWTYYSNTVRRNPTALLSLTSVNTGLLVKESISPASSQIDQVTIDKVAHLEYLELIRSEQYPNSRNESNWPEKIQGDAAGSPSSFQV